MNGILAKGKRLLTWLDVERLLKKETMLWSRLPESIHGVDCFYSSMEVRHSPGATEEVSTWLKEVFGRAYLPESSSIQLSIGNANYPIELIPEKKEGLTAPGECYPLWRDMTYLPKVSENEAPENQTAPGTNKPPENITCVREPVRFSAAPDLVSFHSFKGGVGRTSALMTYVAACLSDATHPGNRKILVVDADLEAPGISFWLDESNRPSVSFVQLLEALHYPPAEINATLDFFADELRKTSLSPSGLQRELFLLPAALDLTEIQDMPVTPERLARDPVNPWKLSEHLHALGKRLGADVVFIDLRAGLSELASPIIFDPRVDHFFVSTVAPQSVQGMAEVLRRLYAYNSCLPDDWQNEARPNVILSLLTKELRDAGFYEQALKSLGSAYPAVDSLTPSVQWLEAEFLNTLMSIGTIREALDILPQSRRLFASASDWAHGLYAKNQPEPTGTSATDLNDNSPLREAARRLINVCKAAEFAEGGQTGVILATEPLLNLGKHFARDLPNVLVIGAKGSGKTFTFREVVLAGSWKAFLAKLGFNQDATTNDACIFPVLWSKNIQDNPDGEIKTAQGKALESVKQNNEVLLSGTDLQKKIDTALKQPPGHWVDFWDEIVASQFGVSQGGLTAVNDLLRSKSARAVLVFDGIEDTFNDAENENAAKAIEALLRLPNRIGELTNPHLGALIFVRIDYVQSTIRQNTGQLLQRFQPFRLHWNAESFLRLAYMLSSKAGLYASPRPAESLNLEELKHELERLWGKKLGHEKSKEAFSARWVYAALCDLKGNVQARDLVRFLRFAADEEIRRSGPPWPQRMLAPESMRKAVPRCSEEKVNEAKAEIASLRKWSEMMVKNQIRNLRVPFSADQAGLDPSTLRTLQEIGVIYEDQDGNLGDERLFLPEIYRTGLGFETSATGRPRMQALLKKNIGIIPL